ncbi:MAG: DEAD/DEAH box helicase, partial [Actinobacteria bacterium]|nr:DEAD/DEAH box helicase [Actinomycetota bacterium]
MKLEDYQWPAPLGVKPFEHQKITTNFLAGNRKAFCFNEQGTGKTASAIWAADYLMKLGLIRRVLVVCPLSIMKSAWQQDLFKFAMHRRTAVAHHAKAEVRRQIVRNSSTEFVIINFDGVEIVKQAIIDSKFDLIIIDEASAYKNAQTSRWKCMRDIVRSGVKGLWMLTGTPAAQSPLDAYGLAKLVNPVNVPPFFGQYRDSVMYKVSKYRWIPSPNADRIVHKALQPAVRFEKSQCLDLPPVTNVYREAPMTPTQRAVYEKLKKEFFVEAAGEEISAVNAAAKLTKLVQISCGAVYTDTKEVVDFDVSPRLAVIEEVIEETSNKVLVFVPYTHTIELLLTHLSKKRIATEVISGDVSVNKRADIINRFQNGGSTKVLIIQPQAASHGLTLTAATHVIHLTRWWNPAVEDQCTDRAYRIGQSKNVNVYYLQAVHPLYGEGSFDCILDQLLRKIYG